MIGAVRRIAQVAGAHGRADRHIAMQLGEERCIRAVAAVVEQDTVAELRQWIAVAADAFVALVSHAQHGGKGLGFTG